MKTITEILSWFNQHSPLLYLTQSLWRDEAFAVHIALQSPAKIIAISVADFNPPLHYLLLHGWIILFGKSEIALRLLSFLFFLFLLIAIYHFSSFLFSKQWRVIITLLFALNPMLLTYAFEVRMYSMYAFFATLTTLALFRNKWFLYVISATLGLYTHSYMPLTIFSHIVYVLSVKLFRQIGKLPQQQLPQISRASFSYSLIAIGLLYLPWVPVLISQWQRSKVSWIYPIDLQLITSSLGNLYLSYEGTPGGWWWFTRLVSLTIFLLAIYALKKKFKTSLLFIIWLFIPVSIILTASLIKPLFVNRYLIIAAVSETFLIGLAITSIGNSFIRKLLLMALFLLLISVNIFHPPLKQKLNTRSMFHKLNEIASKDAIIITDPLVFFDGLYYYSHPEKIFIYGKKDKIPAYVGTAAIEEDKILNKLPPAKELYFVDKNGVIVKNDKSIKL